MDHNPLPNIETYQENGNPVITSPDAHYALYFYQTKETLSDVDVYRNFLKNVEKQFRSCATYRQYKGFLMDLGMNHCQVHGFINSEMATIEMHHAILNLFEISLMITEYFLNTVGYVTTFDVVHELKNAHKANIVPLVMLSLTPHQLYHNEVAFHLHPKMCIGKWDVLIERYKDGLTQDLSFNLLSYLNKSLKLDSTDDAGLLDLRDKILNWSGKDVG